MKTVITLALLVMVVASTSFVRTAADDRQAITQARELSNQAIANKDTAALGKHWATDIVVISSRNSEFHGRRQYQMGFAREFEAGRIFLRKPKRIELFQAWKMASEEGDWYGQWEDKDGPVQLSGIYFAKWHKIDGKWLIRTEIFMPTKCRGGRFCASVPF